MDFSVQVIAGSLLIFVARLVNVSMSTMRTMLGVRRKKRLATTIGFFESLMFILVAAQVLQDVGNVANVLGYAGGFAAGTLVGLVVEERLALGYATVRAFSQGHGDDIISALGDDGFKSTEVLGQGPSGSVHLITAVVQRKEVPRVAALVTRADPGAFITVDTDTAPLRSGSS